MTFPDILRRSWHNLGRAKVRVGLTAAALAIGGATMMLALAITEGVQNTIQKGFGDFKNNYVSVKGFATENTSETGVQTTEEATQANRDARSKSLGDKDVEKFRAMQGVSEVLPLSFYDFEAIEINGKSYKAPSIYPLTPLDDLHDLAAGKREDLKGDTVIVPERYVKQAGVNNPQDFIGKKLTFVNKGRAASFFSKAVPEVKREFTVVGVTKSSEDNSDVDFENAYLSPETMSKLAVEERGANQGEAYYNQILLLTDESQTERVKEELKSQGYEATTRQDNVGKALEAVGAIRIFLLVFAAIAIFTAIFGVINTQLMSVLERTREIGIMKALGLSKSGVLLMFSIEAGLIGLIGSIAGTLLAIPFALLMSSMGGEMEFTIPITIPNFLIVVVVLVVVAMLSGLLPARRASKLDPVEALRNE